MARVGTKEMQLKELRGAGFARMKNNLGPERGEQLRQEVLAEQEKACTLEPAKKSKAKEKKKAATRASAGKSKTDTAIAMLRKGATRKEIAEATKWPSINLAPIVKRHGLKLSVKDGVYHAA